MANVVKISEQLEAFLKLADDREIFSEYHFLLSKTTKQYISMGFDHGCYLVSVHVYFIDKNNLNWQIFCNIWKKTAYGPEATLLKLSRFRSELMHGEKTIWEPSVCQLQLHGREVHINVDLKRNILLIINKQHMYTQSITSCRAKQQASWMAQMV